MTTNDPKAKAVLAELQRLQGDRSSYETAWRDIRTYVLPNAVDFQGSRSPGDDRSCKIYDGTAMQANSDVVGELISTLFNSSERSFGINAGHDVELNRRPEVIAWCDYVADAIFEAYNDERSGYITSAHETGLPLAAFGNAIRGQEWDNDYGHLVFTSYPLACCWFETNKNGFVDKLYREEQQDLRQLLQRFPDMTWEGMDRTPMETKFCLVHAVTPRSDKDREYGRTDGMNKKFKSCWVLKEKQIVLKEGGYDSFPYVCPRLFKVSDETYGRGLAHNCLAEIRMLQRMEWTVIRASEKATDPPIVLPHDGFLMPYQMDAASANYIDPSYNLGGRQQMVETIEHKGNFPVTFEVMDKKRTYVRRCFHANWTEDLPKTERMTAVEVHELQARKLNIMAPVMGRIEMEWRIPEVLRTFELLAKAGRIPPHPAEIDGLPLKITYVSSAARAQAASEVLAMAQLVQQVIPLAQVQPDVLDAIDLDALVQEMAVKMRTSRRIIRAPEDIAAMRQARQEQQQMAAMAGAAEPVSKAVLNLATAQEKGGLAA